MDSAKQSQAEMAATVICALLLSPELTDLMKAIILGVWALLETVSDMRQLMAGGRVPVMKESGDWSTNIIDLFTFNISGGGSDQASGLSYQDYLRVFLGLMDRDTKAARSLDIPIHQSQKHSQIILI